MQWTTVATSQSVPAVVRAAAGCSSGFIRRKAAALDPIEALSTNSSVASVRSVSAGLVGLQISSGPQSSISALFPPTRPTRPTRPRTTASPSSLSWRPSRPFRPFGLFGLLPPFSPLSGGRPPLRALPGLLGFGGLLRCSLLRGRFRRWLCRRLCRWFRSRLGCRLGGWLCWRRGCSWHRRRFGRYGLGGPLRPRRCLGIGIVALAPGA